MLQCLSLKYYTGVIDDMPPTINYCIFDLWTTNCVASATWSHQHISIREDFIYIFWRYINQLIIRDVNIQALLLPQLLPSFLILAHLFELWCCQLFSFLWKIFSCFEKHSVWASSDITQHLEWTCNNFGAIPGIFSLDNEGIFSGPLFNANHSINEPSWRHLDTEKPTLELRKFPA